MKYPQLVSMPSAVSDWLEEQLEARGIDAVVYTRYILSLLHSDTIDVIYSDEDLHVSHLKREVRRSGGSRKRFRRSSDWWRHAQANAERLKRSAAVECLMSASEQNCGIESLVDELCSKLNEIKSDVPFAPPQLQPSPNPDHSPTNKQPETPQEQANRYYAAFPPLSRQSATHSLLPTWLPTTKKQSSSPMKASNRTKQRFDAYFSACHPKKDLSSTELASDQQLNWNMEEENDEDMYLDLPVDIKELLEEEEPEPASHVEMMNLANTRHSTNTQKFIPYRTNISSIWSMDDQSNTEESCSGLDLCFSSISIDNSDVWKTPSVSDWPKWSDLSASFLKLNHNSETSPFVQVRTSNCCDQLFNELPPKKIEPINREPLVTELESDDLLTSLNSHFRPITDKIGCNTVDYQRTDSGSLYVEGKRYGEWRTGSVATSMDMVLQFLVAQNDLSCQADETDAEVEAITRERRLRDERREAAMARRRCTCRNLSGTECIVHPTKVEEETEEEDVWEPRKEETFSCHHCSSGGDSPLWNTDGLETLRRDSNWDDQSLSNIWSGEVCHACLGRPPSTLQHSKLREDVSLDGEQLLSDLKSAQRSLQLEQQGLETAPLYDLLLTKERKRRHSLMATTSQSEETTDSWSFASRLEEDCLIQMSTLPTLRSVTL